MGRRNYLMKVKRFKMVEKIGVCVLLLSLIFVPVSIAADAGAQGNPGPAGTAGLSNLQLAAIAAATIAGIALIATSMSDDDTTPTATHTPAD